MQTAYVKISKGNTFMSKKYTIKDLIFLLLNKLLFLICALIIGAGSAFSVSKFFIAPKYQSNVSLYVKNSNDNSTTKKTQGVDANDLTVSKSLVSTYIVILNSDTVMDKISEKLLKVYSEDELKSYFQFKDGQITNQSLKECFTMAAVNQTEVLNIVATTKNPELSQKLCNIMADVAPNFLIRVVGAGSVEKIGEAKLYDSQVSPNVTKNTTLGAIAGLLIAILIVFIIDFFDNSIKDTSELQERLNKPILGEISHIGGKTKKKDIGKSSDRRQKLINNNNNIPFNIIENYKSMRTNVMFSLSTAENKILAVTSSLPSEGKSVTVANLAVTMAEADKKILLIDGDMRKPVQHKNFKLQNKKGLSTILSGENIFEKCVNRNAAKNLDVLTSGVVPPNPSELLASKNMHSLIDKIKSQYDYILIDTPPILQMTDVIGISDIIAGVAVVVSYGKTNYYEIQEVQKKLELGNCNLTGFILNNITIGSSSSYGYRYSYKYGYKYGYKYKYYAQNYKYEQAKEDNDNIKESGDTK